MFAYLDESGHTGKNIFDKTQPWFYYTCALTKEDIDVVLKTDFSEMCKKLEVSELHANELGIAKLKLILPEIQHLIKKHNIRFIFAQVEKRWFALCKFFDDVFDSGENVAVPWTLYNAPELRHAMLFNVECIMTTENLQSFWNAITQRNTTVAQKTLQDILADALKRAEKFPDKRSREIITEAFQWAIKYPHEFMLNFENKKERTLHLPNYSIFITICRDICKQSQAWNIPVKIIKHHRQEEILGQLKNSFNEFFSCDFKEIAFLGQDLSLGGLGDAKFESVNGRNSCGVQLVDIVQWLCKDFNEIKKFSSDPVINEFMNNVLENTNEIFEISKRKSYEIAKSIKRDFTQKELDEAQKLVNLGEATRKKNMAEYEKRQAQK